MRDVKKSTNSQETRRIRKILNEEARLGISPNSESETEEVDLQKELYPLGHYINNREEMIEQMFSIIRGAKLKKMLPPILKDMPFDELKADCLIHLLGMSKKRIRAILDGREINSSSGSESHSDSSTTPSKKQKVDLKPFVIKQEGCSDISDNSEEVVLVDPDLDFLNVNCNNKKKSNTAEEKNKSKRKQKRKDLDKKHKRTKTMEVKQASETDEVEHIISSEESASEDETEAQAPKEGKTLLEILELEMRARAIRALLKNNDTQEGDEHQKAVDGLNQTSKNSKEKSNKQLKEGTAEKITPAKNFRKKKRKSEDVIVIAPKLVTIDLTDENEQPSVMNNKNGDKEENTPSSSQSNSLDDKSQEVSLNDAPITNNEINQSLVSEKITGANKEFSKEKPQDISELLASCSDGKTSKVDSLNQPAQSEHGKSSWAQRWLESKEVKKVVSTSKICGNIRKKIKIAKLAKKEKQIQDEPVDSSPAPQQEMEGSVGEYELLLKSKTSHTDIDGATDNDTQASVSSANQELTSSEIDLSEISSAEQVQDISSTRAENPSALVQNTEDLQVNVEKTTSTKIELGETDGVLSVIAKLDLPKKQPSSDTNEKNTDVPFTDGEVETNELKSLNKNDNNTENENINSTTETKLNQIISTNELKNLEENEKIKENLKDNLLDKSSENVNTEAHKTKGSEEHDTLPNNENDTNNCESDMSLTGDTATILKTCVGNENKIDSNNKNDIEINSESQQSENDPSEVSEMLKTVVSVSSTKSTQEPNELETLEINITEEDRDIEDVIEESIEQNLSKHVKDSIIVID